jgi:putative acyl-CoA dehydrogenase
MGQQRFTTHEVLNQPPALAGHDVFGTNTALVEGVVREGSAWALDDLHDLGRLAGSAEAIEWGFQANTVTPVLRTHDRAGHRIDHVQYHPAYHRLMSTSVEYGLHAAPWGDDRPGTHVARAAGFITWSHVDAGHTCPISMTYSVVPALRHHPELAEQWLPGLVSREYDPRFQPAATKRGITMGMAMTEKQGGSDVRANSTVAEPSGVAGEYLLTGHKWFCSAPMSDAFLVLAQAPGGLSCFFLPRWRPDGTRNAIVIQRLKDKLGDRSNASSEVEYLGAWAVMVGEEGRGVRTILEMVSHTRLDCILGATAGMRLGVEQAVHHARHRDAFGRRLVAQPLMVNVLADLALEAEAATVVALRLARAHDPHAADDADEHLRRLAVPVAKYWVCKRAPAHAAEAMECLGGTGYVEETVMPRLYRQSPVNGIWEGSGNVICLDVLRSMARDPLSVEAFLAVVDAATGADARLDHAVGRLRKELADLDAVEARARRIVEQMALVLQGALLVQTGPAAVADAFCASRLGDDGYRAFGTLPSGADVTAIVDRALPLIDVPSGIGL